MKGKNPKDAPTEHNSYDRQNKGKIQEVWTFHHCYECQSWIPNLLVFSKKNVEKKERILAKSLLIYKRKILQFVYLLLSEFGS